MRICAGPKPWDFYCICSFGVLLSTVQKKQQLHKQMVKITVMVFLSYVDQPLHSTAIYEEAEKDQNSEHYASIGHSSDNGEFNAPVTLSKAAKQGHKQKR